MSPCVTKSDIFWLSDTFSQVENYIEEMAEPISTMCTGFGRAIFREQIPTSSAESISIEEILNYFHAKKTKIISPSRVRDYLRNYPEIAELSRRVSDIVYQYFDFRAQLCLEVRDYDDPESEYLALYIKVPEYDDSVMDRIREIRESYYDVLDDATGWFLLTTDFAPAR